MIGDILRQEREKQLLTIKDIEVGTSIRGLYIESIEKGEFEKLPGEVYTKGFIRNYASFLKLDPQPCVDQYIRETHFAQNVAEVQPTRESLEDDEKKDRLRQQHRRNGGSRYGAAVAALIFVAVLGGGAYFLRGGDDGLASKSAQTKEVQQKKKAETVTGKISPTKVTDPISGGAPEQKQPAAQAAQPAPPAQAVGQPSDNVQVTATFTGRCWTRVIADGQTVYEGTAEPGKTMSWKGNDTVAVTAGNAGAVEFTHNGKQIGKAGDIGQVVDKIFTKDSVN